MPAKDDQQMGVAMGVRVGFLRFLLLLSLSGVAGCVTQEQRNIADDAQCKNMGAEPGSDIYVQCRLTLSEQHEAARARSAAAGAAMMGAGAQMLSQPAW